MATDAVDNLDEFFDFSQLDCDDGLHVGGQSHHFVAPMPVLDSAMEWEPSALNDPISLASLPSHSAYHECMQAPLDLGCNGSTSHFSLPASVPPQSELDNAMQLNAGTAISWPMNVHDPGQFVSLEPPSVDPVVPPPVNTDHALRSPVQEAPPPTRNHRSGTVSRKPASAKRKGPSTRIPLEARQMLEEEFAANPYPCSWEIDIIAHQANLDAKRVRNWFNNTRSRKKPSETSQSALAERNASTVSLASRLSKDSLEALDKHADEAVEPPQPPLAVYLAQSYQEEAVTYSAIQAAIESGELGDSGDFQETSSSLEIGSGSVITSITSSDGTAPTIYSSGSNMSSFGRNRRRGRRRMEWRTSPYTRIKHNGLNSAGVPEDDLPFFCTFCPRAFKTKYEWIRHEDSVHALRTTWICCDSKNLSLSSCPFCGQARPDEYHLASHKYQQCKNKPESQRTFYRRDHFIQHLHHVHFANVKHPSARLGCQARLLDREGHNFGCKDLAIKWRRFGAPIKADDPMLHCGFCGKRSKNWSERCEHVAEHMYAGEWDRSSWWSERLENHLENLCHPQAVGPFRCRYCQKVFANSDAMNKHSHCRVWSCRFLRSFDDVAAENAGPPLCPQFPSPKAHHCHLCGAGYRSFHVEHAQHYHKYRLCDQKLYTSEEEFLQHLHAFHGASHSPMLRNNSILEQNFSRNKGASFEPLDFDEILQGCRVATPRGSFVDPVTSESSQAHSDPAEEPPRPKPQSPTPPRKKSQEQDFTGQKTTKAQRQRSDSASTKPTPQGPRFFRLNPLVPFLSSRIYYLRSAIPDSLFPDGKAVLEEMPKSYVASLVMSSGLLGMAGVRFPVNMKRDGLKGPVELALEEDDE